MDHHPIWRRPSSKKKLLWSKLPSISYVMLSDIIQNLRKRDKASENFKTTLKWKVEGIIERDFPFIYIIHGKAH